MPPRFRADGTTGKIAIYDVPTSNSTDNTPLTNPRGNLARVRYHSDFSYVREKSRFSATVNLPGYGPTGPGLYTVQDFTLGAHGIPSGVPVFMAIARAVPFWNEGAGPNASGSRDVALLGTVPIRPSTYYHTGNQLAGYNKHSAVGTSGITTWFLTLGSNATHVRLRARLFLPSAPPATTYGLQAYPLSLTIDVLVMQDVI